jgi:hypothetical protein
MADTFFYRGFAYKIEGRRFKMRVGIKMYNADTHQKMQLIVDDLIQSRKAMQPETWEGHEKALIAEQMEASNAGK